MVRRTIVRWFTLDQMIYFSLHSYDKYIFPDKNISKYVQYMNCSYVLDKWLEKLS